MVVELLKAGANPSIKDKWHGSSALHDAAAYGHSKVLSLLIEAGAEINGTNKVSQLACE